MMDEEISISRVCSRHEEFILTELKPRLENLIKVQNDIHDEIEEYEKCQSLIKEMKGKQSYESYVDIGEGNYVQSVLNSCETIYIHVGMGFHVEVDLEKGNEICNERIQLLQKKIGNLNNTIEMVGQDIQEVCYHLLFSFCASDLFLSRSVRSPFSMSRPCGNRNRVSLPNSANKAKVMIP
jgi:prefoldin alpha subunit